MYGIVDRIVLFLSCTVLYLIQSGYQYAIVPVIITIILSSLLAYFDDDRISLAGNLLFMVLCLFLPDYIIFLPLSLYNLFHTKYQFYGLLVLILFLYNSSFYDLATVSFTAIFLITAYLFKYRTDHLKKLRLDYNELRDSSVQLSLLLQEKNRSLLKNQDYEINLATLNERNRISKEIHDNIGHLLSRALLQIGALLTVTKEKVTREGLNDLKESISQGMDQIRNSIHNMYDESIDLYLQLEKIVKEFTFCPVSYDYDIKTTPKTELKLSLIAITKEALTNIMRHSNATRVEILLREHPVMYQLIIRDNGRIDQQKQKLFDQLNGQQSSYSEGMGLRNIYDRVKSFEGNLTITTEKGFQLFITIPKKSV